jgi:PAS domain S-box-containing protein
MWLGSLFRDMPIRHKLRTIILIISGLSLLGACTVFLSYQWFSSREALAGRLAVMAVIVADQSTAAVEFAQKHQAETILCSLKADRQIVIAAVYDKDGKLFARYLREEDDSSKLSSYPGPDGRSFDRGDLIIFQPIQSAGERIGTLCLRSDRAEAWRRLLVNLLTVGLVLLGAAATVTYLSGRLGALITGPLLHLAGVVQAVSTGRDYSIRAERRSRDELGRLIDGFNDMLSQIQAKDSALAHARDELERRVEERTRELQEEIAERKNAELLLQEKDARLTEAQEIARLGSWEWTLSSNRIGWSDEVYRIYGLLPGEFGGGYQEFLDLACPDDRPGLKEALESACRKGEPFNLDYRIICPDGSERFLHGQGKVVPDEAGTPLRLVGTLQDVTELKRADEAIRQLNRELRERMADLSAVNKELEGFSYSVSHDLRAPLRAISGFSRMLVEDCQDQLNSEGRRYLDVINENALKMGKLIDDLLSFSRVGRLAVKKSSIDMEGLAKEVFADLQALNPERKANLQVLALPWGYGDPAMLRQVFVNLLSNAIKYTRGRDPVVIEIGANVDVKETVYYVRDNGVGFDMQYADKLFGVFQRLHSTEEFEGTGVGLALVERIILKHGGRVWGEGKVNEGATFYFALPKVRSTSTPLRPPPSDQEEREVSTEATASA